MAAVLLAAFPLLMLFDTRLAWVALISAIVLSVQKRMTAARHVGRRHVREPHDASI